MTRERLWSLEHLRDCHYGLRERSEITGIQSAAIRDFIETLDEETGGVGSEMAELGRQMRALLPDHLSPGSIYERMIHVTVGTDGALRAERMTYDPAQ